MLDLDSPRWHELDHAYGKASDIPALLRQLEANPDVQGDSKPWESLWSSLCHQTTVYPASYAAVPHLVRIASLAQDPPAVDYFCLPAMIERGRDVPGTPQFPADLVDAYFDAIKHLPLLIPRLATAEWDEPTARYIAACLVGLKGHSDLSMLIDTMDPDEIEAYDEFKHQETVQARLAASEKEQDYDDNSPAALQ